MESKPKSEYEKFKDAMKHLVSVPLAEVKKLEKKKRKTKQPSAHGANGPKS